MALDDNDKMPRWAQDHFKNPNPETWTPVVTRRALARRVLAIARTRIEGSWAAYIDAVPGINHELEQDEVLHNGEKLMEETARSLFPSFNEIPYAR